MKKTVTALLISGMFSTVAVAQEYPNEPKFDCTAEETKMYIEQVTANVFAPSPVPTPEEFQKAYTEEQEARAAAGDGEAASCATIFTDGTLDDAWKDIVDAVQNLDLSFSFSGLDAAALQELLKKAKEKAVKEFNNALEKLGEDICAMMSSENIKEILLDAVNKKYGTNARHLRMNDFADELTEEALLSADKDILLLLSEDEMKSEVRSEARSEMRRIRKDLWDKF
tara:strand:- start:14884 stop:15561 length:678 start_codon:yes stop_codon:yes gene_type:complete